MWTTFLVALKANLRNRQALFWMIVFPIVLATMFNGFFGGLSEGYELKPIPMAVVEDSRWQQADGARTFVDALSGETASSSESLDGTAYADINQQLLTITAADTVRKAEQLLADGTVRGYLAADGNGRLAITISRETVTAANDTTGSVGWISAYRHCAAPSTCTTAPTPSPDKPSPTIHRLRSAATSGIASGKASM